jgi:hypothetical protein
VTEYHYVITLQAQTPRGYATYGVEGAVQAAKDTTRRELFQDVYERARLDMVPVPERAVVLFFLLEPNKLPRHR